MAIGTALALGLGAGALVGGISGAAGRERATFDPSGLSRAIGGLQAFRPGTAGTAEQSQALADIRRLAGGPEAAQAFGAQADLASLLGQLQATGGLPGQEDIAASQAFAAQQLAPQRAALQQAFQQQLQQASQQAALSGRSVNDPILRAKLAQEQTRQQALLEAEQGALAGRTAFDIGGRRLQFAEGRANVLQQALQGRLGLQQNIFGTAQAFGAQELQRGQQQLGALQAAGQQQAALAELQLGQSRANQDLGGGFGGFLKGALGGAGAGAQVAGIFGGGFGSSSAASSPTYTFGQASIPSTPGPSLGTGFSAPAAPPSRFGFRF